MLQEKSPLGFYYFCSRRNFFVCSKTVPKKSQNLISVESYRKVFKKNLFQMITKNVTQTRGLIISQCQHLGFPLFLSPFLQQQKSVLCSKMFFSLIEMVVENKKNNNNFCFFFFNKKFLKNMFLFCIKPEKKS